MVAPLAKMEMLIQVYDFFFYVSYQQLRQPLLSQGSRRLLKVPGVGIKLLRLTPRPGIYHKVSQQQENSTAAT